MAEKEGSLFKDSEKDSVKMFLMGGIYKAYMCVLKKKNIDYIIVNTLLCYKYTTILQTQNNINKIIWWIHEEKRLIRKYKDFIPDSINKKVHIMCVSERIKKNMEEIRKDLPYGIMYYGCLDKYSNENDYYEGKSVKDKKYFTISVIGRICERKNQEQVIEAYQLLPFEIKDKIKIQLIAGSYDMNYRLKIEKKINDNNNIKIIGPISRDKMDNVYLESDLIICSSIDDPLPVVITEAMMYRRPFITSSETGQAYLIKNGENGMVYDINSTKDLSAKIMDCYRNNYSQIMTENERDLFEKYFSLEHLEKQINEIN